MESTTLAAGLLLLLIGAGWWWLRRRRRTPVPAAADKILASLLDATNHEMRSLELGRWFLDQLRAEIRGGRRPCDRPPDYGAIAARVPGTNPVAREEHAKHLRALMALACAHGPGPLAALDEIEARTLPRHTSV